MEKLISSPRAVPRNSRIFAFFYSNCEKKKDKKKRKENTVQVYQPLRWPLKELTLTNRGEHLRQLNFLFVFFLLL